MKTADKKKDTKPKQSSFNMEEYAISTSKNMSNIMAILKKVVSDIENMEKKISQVRARMGL